MRGTAIERFWAKVRPDTDGCWLWSGAVHATGYGIFGPHPGRRTASAHRYSYELHYGPIPNGMHVCHRCDVRNCVRPDHLFLGTASDNKADSVVKDRHARGDRHGRVRLREFQVAEIRSMRATGSSGPQIAAHLGVGYHLVRDVLSGRTWSHLK